MSALTTKDRQILQELSNDGRITNLELAERVNLSPSACLRRVQAMEARGIIEGYRAILSDTVRNVGFKAYVAIGLSKHTKKEQRSFEEAIGECDAVRECHNVTGSFEYMLKIECEDLVTYKHIHTDVLGSLEQVMTISTFVIMDSTKELAN